MPRQVLVGPATVQVDSLGDADFTFLDRIRLRGTATRGQLLRYLSLVDCRVDADLRPAEIKGIEATRTDCTGYRVRPEQIDGCTSAPIIRGYVEARGKQYVQQTLGLSPQKASDLFGHAGLSLIPESDLTSWRKLMLRWAQATGLSLRQVRDGLTQIYSDLPKTRQNQSGGEPPAVDLANVPVHFGQPLDLRKQIPFTRDRWAIARHLEGLYPGWRFWLTTVPFALIVMDARMTRPVGDFWWTRMGWG